MALRKLTKLLRRRAAPKQTAVHDPNRTPEEQELLERIAAGIALNKTPGR